MAEDRAEAATIKEAAGRLNMLIRNAAERGLLIRIDAVDVQSAGGRPTVNIDVSVSRPL